MVRMTTSEARKSFSKTLRAVRAGDRVLLTKHGKGVVAIVTVADLRLLEMLEDRADVRAAREALAEAEGTVSWDEVKASLGL